MAPAVVRAAGKRPNVVLIITDDQGYGDLSLHGNPHLQTPHTDSVGREGVQFTQFHVNPVCSPTRSSVMTGRYYYRTGVTDTYLGRSMMHNDETTLPELLKGAGYRTGLFGKWHLGDCYPLRSIDQGFEESLNCTGGGLTQPSDPVGNTYFDPMLRHNGQWVKKKGYCTDIFFDAALGFIEANRNQPFFTYIATNAPHDPLQIDDKYVDPFRKAGLNDRDAKTYGMCKNLDDNVGRLLAKLRELKLEQNTIFMFMTDNGPQQPRFNGGMRAHKGSVYEGGIRVPFLLRWPGGAKGGLKHPQMAAHIDIMPTITDACGVARPKDLKIDGRSFLPILKGAKAAWTPRTLFFQWHRGERPNPFQNAAAIRDRYKLVNGKELYDLQSDPAEKTDIAAQNPDMVKKLRADYDAWFADVSATRNYEPPKIYLGAPQEKITTLTRQDWRGPQASWDATGLGHWEVDVRQAANYDITLRLPKAEAERKATFTLGDTRVDKPFPAGTTELTLPGVRLNAGSSQLKAVVDTIGAHYVDVKRV